MNTILSDKVLWYDGSYTLSEDQLSDRLLHEKSLDNCFIEEMTNNIRTYNLIADKPLDVKYTNSKLDLSWSIPEKYLQIDLLNYCKSRMKDASIEAMNRLMYELDLIQNLRIENLIRCVIYILDSFKTHNVVWGVGRGSSCASYVLYVLGLHCVDCIKYKIDAKEFFKIQ